VKPSLDGGAGTAHRLRDAIQSQFARQTKLHGKQSLAQRAGRFSVQTADDQVSLTATI
jgi:hypothetical protein